MVYHGICTDTFSVPITVINTTGIDEFQISDLKLQVQPNPSNGNTIVKWQTYFKQTELAVFDVTGKKVKSIPLSSIQNSQNIDASEFENGVYGVQLIGVGIVFGREKMVVLK